MIWHEWREAPACDYAVLGDPIHHSRSPQMHKAAYQALGLDLAYRAVRVPLAEFDLAIERLASLGVKGVNCTLPLKGSARAWAETRGGLVGEELGCQPGPFSANTLDLTTGQGISTDEAGFLALIRSVFPVGKPRFLLLGAGGTGQAILCRLLEEKWPVSLWNRTPGKWESLMEGLDGSAPVLTEIDLSGIDVVVNATSSGLTGPSLPIPWESASPNLAAIDLLYGKETSFLSDARDRGLTALNGSLMLMEQGALSFEWWLDRPAPRSAMLEAIHADPSAL